MILTTNSVVPQAARLIAERSDTLPTCRTAFFTGPCGNGKMAKLEELVAQAKELQPIITVLSYALLNPQNCFGQDLIAAKKYRFPYTGSRIDTLNHVLALINAVPKEKQWTVTTAYLMQRLAGTEHEEFAVECLVHSEEFAALELSSPLTYAEKLKHPKWQRRRLEILSRDDFKCVRCFRDDITLHVHHKKYERNRDPWDYPDEALETLCANCHGEEHA